MKKSEFRKLIREEIRKVINEAVTINIVDTFHRYNVATITGTNTQSEIVDYLGDWKYVYNGSPDQLVKELIKVKAIHKASGKYTESDSERDTIRSRSLPRAARPLYKGIKALGSKLKKVKV